MPWKRICKIPLNPKKKPATWSGPEVTKLEQKDQGGLVRAFMVKHWKKLTSVLDEDQPPILDVSHDSAKGLFRLVVTPHEKASKESRKQISGLDAKVRKVFLDSTGSERQDVADDGIVKDDQQEQRPSPENDGEPKQRAPLGSGAAMKGSSLALFRARAKSVLKSVAAVEQLPDEAKRRFLEKVKQAETLAAADKYDEANAMLEQTEDELQAEIAKLNLKARDAAPDRSTTPKASRDLLKEGPKEDQPGLVYEEERPDVEQLVAQLRGADPERAAQIQADYDKAVALSQSGEHAQALEQLRKVSTLAQAALDGKDWHDRSVASLATLTPRKELLSSGSNGYVTLLVNSQGKAPLVLKYPAADESLRRVERWRTRGRVRWPVHAFRRGPQSGSPGHVSSALPKIPYGGFSPVRLQAPGTW